MLFIKDELENYSYKIEDKKRELKNLISEILKTSQSIKKPEENIYNLKQDIFIELKENLNIINEVLDKFEDDIRINEIRNEISIENISINTSNIYNELEKIKEISIQQIDDIEDFFKGYNIEYKKIIGINSGNYLLKSIEEKYFITKFDKNFITLDENENRKKLLDIEKFYYELIDLVKYFENTNLKFKKFLELTKVFLEQKELLEIAIEEVTEEIYEIAMKELEEKREKFLSEKQEEYSNILNKLVGEIYLKNKDKKNLLILKSKKAVQKEIEESTNLEKVIEKILIYLNITSKEKELLEKPELLLKEKINEEINIFQFRTSYKILKYFIEEELEKKVKLNSKFLKNSIQEFVEDFKLAKKILKEEIINLKENRVDFFYDIRKVTNSKENILEELENRIEMKYPHLRR